MEWNKAGRKKKVTPVMAANVVNTASVTISDDEYTDDEYTKEELTLYTRGVFALACAVINQWIKDGKPATKGIQPWFDIVEMTKENKS